MKTQDFEYVDKFIDLLHESSKQDKQHLHTMNFFMCEIMRRLILTLKNEEIFHIGTTKITTFDEFKIAVNLMLEQWNFIIEVPKKEEEEDDNADTN